MNDGFVVCNETVVVDSTYRFNPNNLYRMFNAEDGQGEYILTYTGKRVKVTDEMKGKFSKVKRTNVYVVIRYADTLPEHEYGVSDDYYLVGIFKDPECALEARDATTFRFNEPEREFVHVLVVEMNKEYEPNEQLFLGGGYYIE